MMLILMAWLVSALLQLPLTPICSAAPTSPSGIVRLHRAPEKVSKDAPLSIQPADVPIRAHPETTAATGHHEQGHQQFLTPKDMRLAHISAVETQSHSLPANQHKGRAAHHSQRAHGAKLTEHSLSASNSHSGTKPAHFSPFSFLQESPLPNTVVVIFVFVAVVILLILLAIISHYVLSNREEPRRGYPIPPPPYDGQSEQCEPPVVPAFNDDVFSAAIASRQFSTLNSFNSLYNLPPGFIERKTPREIEYERRVMNTRLAPHSDAPQRSHSRQMESPATPRGGRGKPSI